MNTRNIFKKTFSNVATCMLAFLCGITINMACANSTEDFTKSNTHDSTGEFYVDGLYFNRDGFVSSKILYSEYNGSDTEDKTYYEYDEKGRISKVTSYRNGSLSSVQSYTYGSKEVKYVCLQYYNNQLFYESNGVTFYE